jgi:hypothetical protein
VKRNTRLFAAALLLSAVAPLAYSALRPKAAPPLASQIAAAEEREETEVAASASPSFESPPPNEPPARKAPEPLPVPDNNAELALMAELRSIARVNPTRAADLAEAGNRRFPRSASAPERSSIMVDALLALDRYPDARAEAERMQELYPGNEWAVRVEGRTGAHSHRDQASPNRAAP